MSDMSYCMCENAARDLQRINEDLHLTEDTSEHEILAALRLIVYCSDFLLDNAESIINFAESLKDEKYSRAIKNAESALEAIEDYVR